ncbi:pentapeptide repeat-containing protein [Polymorphospora rubra]|uniref:pentapeptide repeat-containing protein n=1 Tax=Polymorphospora rubra TaxID=338584 RepID=UPI0033E2ECD7
MPRVFRRRLRRGISPVPGSPVRVPAPCPRRAVLRRAVLRRAVLRRAVLRRAVLRRAVLRRAVLRRSWRSCARPDLGGCGRPTGVIVWGAGASGTAWRAPEPQTIEATEQGAVHRRRSPVWQGDVDLGGRDLIRDG